MRIALPRGEHVERRARPRRHRILERRLKAAADEHDERRVLDLRDVLR